MPDLTNIFRATVQELDQTIGSTSKPGTKTPKRQPDLWIKEAHQIAKSMTDLRTFILTTRPIYLNISRGVGTNGAHGGLNGGVKVLRKGDSTSNSSDNSHTASFASTSSKVLNDLLETVSSLTSLSDKDRDSIDTQVKVMMKQIKGAIEELENLEQGSSTGTIDDVAQHRQGVTLYLNERLASLATLHKDQYEARITREMEKRESSLHRALPKPPSTSTGGNGLVQRRNPGSDHSPSNNNNLSSTHRAGKSTESSGISSSQYYQQQPSSNGFVDDDQDFESSLTEQERQMLQLENENIVQKLETELNQVRQLETSMIELATLHNTIQEHLEAQTLQTNRLHEEALTAIGHIDAGNDQLVKAGKHNQTTRKWILFFLIMAR
ncbi:hypothetical protein BGZ76_009166 [Entomortierella beljakovae]|nr:hypothetical protein BGZ76_009166 [Entomortierella beljakovae]